MTTATDYVSAHPNAASAGSAPFTGMDDGELDELRRSILHSLEQNAVEELELKVQLRILRAEIRLRNAKQMEVSK